MEFDKNLSLTCHGKASRVTTVGRQTKTQGERVFACRWARGYRLSSPRSIAI